jgi:hypothetical protein
MIRLDGKIEAILRMSIQLLCLTSGAIALLAGICHGDGKPNLI